MIAGKNSEAAVPEVHNRATGSAQGVSLDLR